MAKKVPAPVPQSGVLPYRSTPDGLQVLLVTSRTTGDWIPPKGHIEPFMSPQDSAAKEAWEEAGVFGDVLEATPFPWEYSKKSLRFRVDLYPMRVSEVHSIWPEHLTRKRKWMGIAKAIDKVNDPRLKLYLRSFAELVANEETTEVEATA